MPLSEEELRLLEQMERALVAEDPKLASTMRGTTLRAHARRRSFIAAGAFAVGVVVLMTGAVMAQIAVGVAGFLIMLGSAYVGLVSWRGQSRSVNAPEPVGHSGFTVIQGGRAKKRRGRSTKQPSSGSVMERFEERWRRRREQNGL